MDGVGLGIVLVKGIPVSRLTRSEVKIFYWGLGLHLGVPGMQSSKNDLIGDIVNEFYGKQQPELGNDNDHTADISPSGRRRATRRHGSVRQFRTNEHIPFHCDLADVVGLLCLQTALPGGGGGASRIASSVTIYNRLLTSRPDLVPLMYDLTPLDTRGEGSFN